MDAALYDLSPPRVTTLYGLIVPQGPRQTCRYDDGTEDKLSVSLATTAFVSGKTMFDILPAEYKSLAVRTKVKYAPHPFVWMARAGAMPTGLGIESDGLELPLDKLPSWEEAKQKTYPVVSWVLNRIHGAVSLSSPAMEEPYLRPSTFPSPPLWYGGTVG
jgi:hypothetical protein